MIKFRGDAIKMSKLKPKACAFCGKEFIPNSNNQRYCKGPHYRKCPVCGKEYLEDNVENLKRPPVACSYECRVKRTQITSMKKYGVTAPGNNPEARKKASETMMKNLGVPYAMMSKEVQEKAKITNNERYGCDNAGSSSEVIMKRMETNRQRYGDTLPFNRPECYEKQQRTMLKRWGYKSFLATPQFTESHNNGRDSKLNQNFSDRLSKHHIEHIKEYRMNIPKGTFYIYDFYIPEIKTLIELNPTYTHSSIKTSKSDGYPPDYHYKKTAFAMKNGYRCINVWDWDDWYKIIDMLKKPTIQISAHDCEIYKLHPSIGKRFIENYDIYGNSRGQVLFLGLVLKGELVQVMSFKKASSRSKYDVQIASMCTKKDYQVYGGFVKLLRFATEYYELYNIVAYNDLSKFSGEVFEHMNMKLDHINPPQLIWYNETTGKHIADSIRYLYHKTKEDMINESYLPIYTCGSSVYVYV